MIKDQIIEILQKNISFRPSTVEKHTKDIEEAAEEIMKLFYYVSEPDEAVKTLQEDTKKAFTWSTEAQGNYYDLGKDQITFKQALDIIRKTLREDQDLYDTYKANIAMSFYDACRESEIQFPQLSEVSRKGASIFLNLLLIDIKDNE